MSGFFLFFVFTCVSCFCLFDGLISTKPVPTPLTLFSSMSNLSRVPVGSLQRGSMTHVRVWDKFGQNCRNFGRNYQWFLPLTVDAGFTWYWRGVETSSNVHLTHNILKHAEHQRSYHTVNTGHWKCSHQ